VNNRTLNATEMPADYLKALLEGRISFDEAYSLYPGPAYEFVESVDEKEEETLENETW